MYLSLLCLVFVVTQTGADTAHKDTVGVAIAVCGFIILCTCVGSVDVDKTSFYLCNIFMILVWGLCFVISSDEMNTGEYFITNDVAVGYIGDVYKAQALFNLMEEKYDVVLSQPLNYQLIVDSLTNVTNVSADSNLAYVKMQDEIIAFNNAVYQSHAELVNFKDYLKSTNVGVYNMFDAQINEAIKTFNSLTMVNDIYLSYIGKEKIVYAVFALWILLNITVFVLLKKDKSS
jgi:hypothetical protein